MKRLCALRVSLARVELIGQTAIRKAAGDGEELVYNAAAEDSS